jgi:hypothetical protein
VPATGTGVRRLAARARLSNRQPKKGASGPVRGQPQRRERWNQGSHKHRLGACPRSAGTGCPTGSGLRPPSLRDRPCGPPSGPPGAGTACFADVLATNVPSDARVDALADEDKSSDEVAGSLRARFQGRKGHQVPRPRPVAALVASLASALEVPPSSASRAPSAAACLTAASEATAPPSCCHWSGVGRVEVSAQERVEVDEELAHAGHQRHLRLLAPLDEV